MRQVTEVNIRPPHDDVVSQNIPVYVVPPEVDGADALVLHHGSGNVPSDDPRVISLDVLPCANVDVVGEAKALPFADGTFAYVESGAVFEHLHDPLAAIGEIRRVLDCERERWGPPLLARCSAGPPGLRVGHLLGAFPQAHRAAT